LHYIFRDAGKIFAMPLPADLLTAAEAAVIADVPLRSVNRAIDEHILPESLVRTDGGRRIRAEACAYLRFYVHAADKLTADQRQRVIGRLAPVRGRPPPRVVVDGFLTVDFDPFIEETIARHEKLVLAREMVVEDPDTLSGLPVIRGTRIPVHDVAAALRSGQPHERIRRAYSGLTDEQIELASLYADANPPRGRPRRKPSKAARLVSDRKIPRRRRG
jgi:uncharacterized protein (DUF433 family)